MRSVLTLAMKDLRLLVRDRAGLFFIVGFPVIMGIGFGFIGSSFKPGEPSATRLKIALIDDDQSEMSRLFIDTLADLGNLDFQPLPLAEATNLVRKGKLAGFIKIPAGFGETAGIMWAHAPIVEVGMDPSRGAAAGLLQGRIMQAMGRLVQHRFTDTEGMRRQLADTSAQLDSDSDLPAGRRMLLKGFLGTVDVFLGSMGEFMNSTGDDGEGVGGPTMELARVEMVDVLRKKSEQSELLGKLRSDWDISFPAAIMWGVMACVAGFAISLVKERSDGTYLRLRIAPITRSHILGGKAVGCFIAVIAVIGAMMTLGLILGIQLASPALLAIAALSIAIGFTGLMMLMSVVGNTEAAISGAAWGSIVIMCMFGGGMMPLAFLPSFMQTVSHFSPVKWGILALEGAIWRDFSPSEMVLPCAILLGMGAICFGLGVTILTRKDG